MTMSKFPHGVSSFGMPVIPMWTTGNVFFVNSATGSNTVSDGKDPIHPVATLAQAISKATASNGDLIIVMPGHAETVTTSRAINKAGITIMGLGNGDLRPTFTLTGQVPLFSVSAANVSVHNIKFYSATASTSYAMNLLRVAASNFTLSDCEFRTAQKMYHTVRIVSGDQVTIKDSVFVHTYAPGAGAAGIKNQNCILNIGGTNVVIKNCRFNDTSADAAYKWKAVIEGGKLTASLNVVDCDFVCRGIATRTRTAAASGFMATKYCRGISPSSNTAVGGLFLATYQFILESYNVAAVNKIGVIAVTTSDIRFKRQVMYL